MEDIERANMVLRRIGEMPYFDPEAIIKVLVNEFAIIRKEVAQQTRVPDGALVVRDSSGVVTCSVCGTGLGVE